MICIDASVAVKWVLPEEQSDVALALIQDAVGRRERIVAPHLMPVEVTNTIRRRMYREGLSFERAQALLDAFLTFPVTIAPTSPKQYGHLHQHALTLSTRFDLPAVYDAYYLALADLRRCTLWTADQQLIRAVGNGPPSVRWIGDYAGI